MIIRRSAALTQPLAGCPWPPTLQTIAWRLDGAGAVARWMLAASR